MIDAYAALRHPFVRHFAIGRFAAIAGWQIINVAVGWQLYERTGDPWSLGLVGVVELAPVLCLMIAAGHIADRYPRRNVAIFAHGLVALAAIGLALVSWLQAPTAAIYLLLALIGTGRAFASPSVSTILPQLLAPAEFANANAWLSSIFQLAAISGPALGGLLIAQSGTATVSFVAAAVGQIVFIALLHTLPVRRPVAATTAPSAHDLFAGFRFIRRNPLFLAAITLDLFAVLFGGAVALLPIFAKDILDVGPTGLGFLRAAPAVGSLASALVITRYPIQRRAGRKLFVVVAGFGICMVAFGLSRTMWLSILALALGAAFDTVSVVLRSTILPLLTPDELRGRVTAVEMVFISASNELGAFESGVAAALIGAVPAVVLGGVATVVVAGVWWRLFPSLARVDRLDELRPVALEPG